MDSGPGPTDRLRELDPRTAKSVDIAVEGLKQMMALSAAGIAATIAMRTALHGRVGLVIVGWGVTFLFSVITLLSLSWHVFKPGGHPLNAAPVRLCGTVALLLFLLSTGAFFVMAWQVQGVVVGKSQDESGDAPGGEPETPALPKASLR